MKRVKLMLVVLGALLIAAAVEGADNMKAFPSAEAGMVRHVLKMPKQEDESAFKVELMIGKTLKLDKGNRYFFGGKMERVTIKGWGFSCYKVSKLGPMAGTRMGVDPNAPKADRFITMRSEPDLIRYNSRLPLVVYVPEGVEVRCRIWRADQEVKVMEAG